MSTTSAVTRPVPSAHIENRVSDMARYGYLRRITWATDAPFSTRYFPVDVPSMSNPGTTHRVVYDDTRDTMTCTCPAGSFGRVCSHAEAARVWLGLRGIR